MTTTKVKYLVIKTEEPGGLFVGARPLSQAVLNAYPDGEYSEFRPMYDKLIIDAELTEEGNKITIKGKECTFLMDLRSEKERHFDNKIFLYNEVNKDGTVRTPAEVVKSLEVFSKGKYIPNESDIKLGYEKWYHKLLNKKSFYIDANPDIISAIFFMEKESIKKDEKGYFVASWYQSTLMPPKDFEMTTNSYRLTTMS